MNALCYARPAFSRRRSPATFPIQFIGAQLFGKMALSFIASSALWTATTVAQEHDATGAIDPRLQAFDGDVVGYDGMAVDMKVVSIAYDEIDYEIADYKKQIEEAQALIDLREKVGGTHARSAIAVHEHDIAIAQARIHELELKKAMRDAGSECDSTLNLWRQLSEFLASNMATEQGYVEESPPGSDVRVDFQNQVDRDRTQLAVTYSQIYEISQACKLAADNAKAMERIAVAFAEINKQAETAGAEAITIAKKGHFKDLPAISQKLQLVLGAARLNQLTGYEIGLEQTQLAIKALDDFTTSAATACVNESFDLLAALSLRRQEELLLGRDSLNPCLYRLREIGGGQIPNIGSVQIRSCSDGSPGETHWEIRVKTKVENFHGSGDSTSENRVSGTVNTAGGTGTAKMSGLFTSHDNVTLPYNLNMEGTVRLKSREIKAKAGLVTRLVTTMAIDWTVDAHSVTNVFGQTVIVPAFTLEGEEEPVVILNDNKPCDPAKSVWDYR